MKCITGGELCIALHILLESEYSVFSTLETKFHYTRRHDGINGEEEDDWNPINFLDVFFVGHGDVCVVFPLTKKLKMWRFRNCVGGGGQSPRICRALIVLMEAIRRDNKSSLEECRTYSDNKVKEALNLILESNYWINTITIGNLYERMHDDTGGSDDRSQYLSLEIDSSGNSDVHISIYPGNYRTLRFRSPAGGGKSERVRKALMILMEAIRRDNEKNPEP